MRFDTHRISAYLIRELQKARPRLEVIYDGGDLIRVALGTSETAQIYLVENPITVYEIKGIVTANTAVGTYTLFILWGDLLLPLNRTRYRPNDWMEALLALHGDKIYAYDAFLGEKFYVFPVYFEGAGVERSIRHGEAIDATGLIGETIQTRSPLIAGAWRMANFEARLPHAPPINPALNLYYRRLGIAETARRSAVKRAYRRLARQYHPDLNNDPGATLRMQQINEAYERILEALAKGKDGKDDA